LDHTAEVLENYRRLQENIIFDRILDDERNKKAFLKHEGRNIENLISDFDTKFGSYKYLEDTSNSLNTFEQLQGGKASSIKFLEEEQVYRSSKELKEFKNQYKIEAL
tara:strand:+ start:162 stop:482 length:321 start_codon:yes stop_codon:yes gene_type:complete